MRRALILGSSATVVTLALAVLCGYAQAMKYKVFEQTTHQLRVTQDDGSPILDGPYVATFSLWDSPGGGTLLWSESQTIVITAGLADVKLGEAIPIPSDVLSDLDFDTTFVPYLQTEFDGEILSPRVRLTAAPYARVAERLSGDFITDDGVMMTALGKNLETTFETISTATGMASDSGAAAIVVDTGGVALMMTSRTPTGTDGYLKLSTGANSGTPFDGPIGLSVESGQATGPNTSRSEFGIESGSSSGRLSWDNGFDQSHIGWYAGPDSAADSMVVREAASGRATGHRRHTAATFSKSTWDVFENLPMKQAGKRLTKAEIISELSGTGFYLEEDEDSAIVMHASSDKRKQSLYFPESLELGIGLEVTTTGSKLFVGNLPLTGGAVDTGVVLDGSGDVTVNGQLNMSGNTGALIVPRMTTSERDAFSGANGMIIYNTDHNAFNFFENGGWVLKQNVGPSR